MMHILLIACLWSDPDSLPQPPETLQSQDLQRFAPWNLQDTTDYKAKLEEILRRNEFQREPENRNLLSDGLDWLLKKLLAALKKLFGNRPPSNLPVKLPAQDFSVLANALMYVLLAIGAIALAFILYRLVQYYRSRDKSKSAKGEGHFESLLEPGESLEPDEHFESAQQEARTGHYRKAIRHLLISIVLFLDKENMIHYPSRLTNWEFFSLVQKKEALAGLVEYLFELNRLFDRKWYGMEPSIRDDFENALQKYTECMNILRDATKKKVA